MPNIFNLVDHRWNAGGTVFKGILLNIDNGSGGAAVFAAGSNLFELQNNTITQFSIDPTGKLTGLASNWQISSAGGGVFATLSSSGSFNTAPPNTQSGTSYSIGQNDTTVIFTNAAAVTVTLPTPSGASGRWLILKETGAGAVSSASSNVVLIGGGAAQATITTAAGKFAYLQSDGTNWIIMMSN